MGHIVSTTQEMVARIKDGEIPEEAFATIDAPCPKCGGVIQENYKKFQCKACDFSLWKVVAGRQYESEEVEELLTKRTVGPLQGFRSKMGRAFAAIIKLNAEHQPEFDFGQSNEGSDEEVDFSEQESIGPCPKCQSAIYENGMAYVCEKSVGAAKTCDFRSGKVILQQEIDRAQMVKLLTEGKTDLLKGFVSNRTKRKFSAFLVRGPDGKTGFEFEARAPKAPKAGKASPAGAEGAEATADTEAAPAKAAKASKTAAAAKTTKAKAAPKKRAAAK
ncbi:MAG: topoisomerase C-terminal repeat-containing protein, partial [Rhodocyclaceae bacterium]|nr:topoisomerase C-terminal repeat-containing protein [Rhodocyclaceae bacterium]